MATKKKASETYSDAASRRYQSTRSNERSGLGKDYFYLDTVKDRVTGKTTSTWRGTGRGKAIAAQMNRQSAPELSAQRKAKRSIKKI